MSREVLGSITSDQWDSLLTAVKALGDHQSYSSRILTAALPTFIAFVLGLFSALFLDWLRTRRELLQDHKVRRTNELERLNIVLTVMAYNLETTLHFVRQQIIPHFEHAWAAHAEATNVNDKAHVDLLLTRIGTVYRELSKVSPTPYLIEIDLFEKIPFVLGKKPSLLQVSARIIGFSRLLKDNLRDRNILIEKGANEMRFPELRDQIFNQVNVGRAEIVHSLQLLQEINSMLTVIQALIADYADAPGAHLRVDPPPTIQETINILIEIVKRSGIEFGRLETYPET